jgi:hypothetical protein
MADTSEPDLQYPTCRHVKVDGTFCGSPALRNRQYCYTHQMQRGRRLRRALALSRNEPYQLLLPPLEDLASVKVALSEIVQALACGQLDQHAAGKMLYAIQQATTVMLRMAEMEQRAQSVAAAPAQAPASPANPRLEDYPEFERNFDIPLGADLDAEADKAMARAQEFLAARAVAPPLQPGGGCPVPAKLPYNREEGYQMMQWEILRLRREVRASQQRDPEFQKKQPASSTPPPDPAAGTGAASL